MVNLLLLLITNKLYSFIKQWLLLNPITSIYIPFTETDALLEKTYAPENTLCLTREMFSINFVSCVHCLSIQSQNQKGSSQLKLRDCKHSVRVKPGLRIFVNSPWFCLDPSGLDLEKPTKSLGFLSGNCCLFRKLSFRESILGT